MIATSLLEVFMLLFTWRIYDVIWDILVGTGIGLVPFIAVIIKTMADNYGEKSLKMLRDAERTILTMIVVLLLCVVPYTPASSSLSNTNYAVTSTECRLTGGTGEITGSSSNVNNASAQAELNSMFPGGWDANVPVAWGVVNYLSTAVTYAAIRAMGCEHAYQKVVGELKSATVDDGNLRQRAANFQEICYKKALDIVNSNGAFNRTALSPVEDLDWMGSRWLVANVYPTIYISQQEANGFTRDEINNVPDAENPPSTGANVYCSDAWATNGIGLRDALFRELDSNAGDEWDNFEEYGFQLYDSSITATDEKEELWIKTAMQANPSNSASAGSNLTQSGQLGITDLAAPPDMYDRYLSTVWDTGKQIGSMLYAFTNADSMAGILVVKDTVDRMIPMLISLAQGVIVVAAPFVMLFGGYKFQPFAMLAVTYFSLEFTNAIVQLAMLFDAKLWKMAGTAVMDDWDPQTAMLMAFVGFAQMAILPIFFLGIMINAGGQMLKGTSQSVGGGNNVLPNGNGGVGLGAKAGANYMKHGNVLGKISK